MPSFTMDGTTIFSKSGSDITYASGNLTNALADSNTTYPAGHVIQMISPDPSIETNTLTTSYVNLYEVGITLKGGNSKVFIIFGYNYYVGSES